MSFFSDFKAFAMKDNVLDMAVGVIIGGAFGKIVSSLVSDIIMPAVSLATGSVSFTDLSLVLRDATEEAEAVTLNYGMFIQNIVDFLIIALSIFCVLRVMMKFQKKAEEAPAAPAEPSKEEVLLGEIRDQLKQLNQK